MGHEYCGVVEEVGQEVTKIKPGQFVVGSFATSDNTCAICKHGYQSSCVQREFMSTAQASVLRVPLAEGPLSSNERSPSERTDPQFANHNTLLQGAAIQGKQCLALCSYKVG